jgi:acetolactate synthase-1/3 small subunit
MTIVVNGDNRIIDQVMKQLDKLIDVIEIEQLPVHNSVRRELILVKVQVDLQSRQEVIQIAEIFRARIVDVATSGLTLELTGTEDKLSAFINLLEPFTIEQIMRTGFIAVGRF